MGFFDLLVLLVMIYYAKQYALPDSACLFGCIHYDYYLSHHQAVLELFSHLDNLNHVPPTNYISR